MAKDIKEIEVSTKHLGLRITGFVLALVIAVAAFGYGVSRIGHKDPGYYNIEADASDEVPFYRNGINLTYRFDGKSDEIKAEMNSLKAVYGSVLLSSYKLLDCDNEYSGYANIATLNKNLGKEIELGDELMWIISDAYTKTLEKKGMNLFAGALISEWDSILSLDELGDFDPADNPQIAKRLSELAEKTSELSAFSITKTAENKVKISIDSGYLEFLKSNGYTGSIITTGRMTEAYRLKLIRDELEKNGYTNGYLYSSSGLTLSLSGHDDGEYAIYGLDDEGDTIRYAGITAGKNAASSFLRSFPLTKGETMYHDLGSGKYYNPNFSLETGSFPNQLLSGCTVRYDGDIVEACYENIKFFSMESREEIEASCSASSTFACIFISDPVLYTNGTTSVRAEKDITVKEINK